MIDLSGNPALSEEGLENAKNSILIIEGLMFALTNSQIPFRFVEKALNGANFLQNLHQTLVIQIGPEEVEKLRKTVNANVPPPPTSQQPNTPTLVN